MKEVLVSLGVIYRRLQGYISTDSAVSVFEVVDISQIGFNGCIVIFVLLGMMLQVRCL